MGPPGTLTLPTTSVVGPGDRLSSVATPGEVLDPSSVTTAGTQVEGRTPWQLFWRRFRQDKFAIAGCFFIVIMSLLAIFAPFISKSIAHRGPNDLFIYET